MSFPTYVIAAPARVLFFDELDSIARSRGGSSGGDAGGAGAVSACGRPDPERGSMAIPEHFVVVVFFNLPAPTSFACSA